MGGKQHLAVIEKIGETWSASHVDTGEIEEQLVSLEKYVSEFGLTQLSETIPVPVVPEPVISAANTLSTGAK